ncbi:MAG TPA: hypothetical protein VFZ23_16680 [Pyrinomonadaceae bacterium]
MKKRAIYFVILILTASVTAVTTHAQRATFRGTAVIYGSGLSTRTVTRPFTMTVNSRTSEADTTRYLRTLERGGQDALLREIESNNLGRFALTGSVGVPLSAVVVDRVEGETRLRAVFRRWIGFGELRRGYRSVDYPFGYVEIHFDPRTGRGEGTIIPAARIRFRNSRDGGPDTVEIEDFGTFPGRLLGVRVRGAGSQLF